MTKTNLVKSLLMGAAAVGLATTASAQNVQMSADKKAVAYTPSSFASARSSGLDFKMSKSQMDNAKSRMPMIKDVSQLPNVGVLSKSDASRSGSGVGSGFSSQALGAFGGFPFSSRSVAQAPNSNKNAYPVDTAPYQQTGKLFMDFGGSFFVCSGSVLQSGLVLTAAHCVHEFGSAEFGFADRVFFLPALHNDVVPYGVWTAQTIVIPETYFDGTDRCLPGATGVVCENDIAILVMNSRVNENEVEEEVGDVVGRYSTFANDRGYTALGGDGDLAAHITQISYPSAGYTGERMIQAESIAVQDAPFALGPDTDYNQVIMGSNMTGGSSGGPWIHNFGKSDGYAGTAPVDSQGNRVAAVTSWGFTNDSIKIQGASRFGHNTAYPKGGPTNIKSLIDLGCSLGETKC